MPDGGWGPGGSWARLPEEGVSWVTGQVGPSPIDSVLEAGRQLGRPSVMSPGQLSGLAVQLAGLCCGLKVRALLFHVVWSLSTCALSLSVHF